jgi:hypothetical protein
MSAKMIVFHVPSDERLLAAFGAIALRHEHMNHILKMTIKSLTGVTPGEAIAATMFESSAQLRERVRKIARKRLGDGAALVKLQAILANCKRLSERRNELVHGLWAQDLDGDAHVRDAYGETRPLPTVEELYGLARELEQLTGRLNFERLEGFLRDALETRGHASSAA